MLTPYLGVSQNAGIKAFCLQNPAYFYANPAAKHLPENHWLVSPIRTNGMITSNTGEISLNDIFHVNANFLRQNVLGTKGLSTGSANVNIAGASVSYGIAKDWTISISTDMRMHANYWNTNGRLVSEIGEVVKVPQEYPYEIQREDMKMTAAAFSSISFSTSYNIFKNTNHSLFAGLTTSVINGVAHTSIDVGELSGVIKRINSYLTSLTSASGKVNTVTSGDLFSDFNFENLFRVRKKSLGSSLGIQYEYRRHRGDEPAFVASVSLSDIGKVRYVANPQFSKGYRISIPPTGGLYFNNNFKNSNFSRTAYVFDKYPEFFENLGSTSSSYQINLPTTLSIFTDTRLDKNLFLSVASNIPTTVDDQVTHLHNFAELYVSPRFQRKNIVLSIPFHYQIISGLNAGLGIGYHGFFLGSDSVIRNVFKNGRQLEIFMGYSFGIRRF